MKTVERLCLVAGSALALAAAPPAQAAANIVLYILDPPGVGFLDNTPAAPVGGNTGTTVGQQRAIAFLHAAGVWSASLTSSVPIEVEGEFLKLSCNATAAVLGSSGPITMAANFAGQGHPETWYPGALANKLAGRDLNSAASQIAVRLNVDLGTKNCLAGSPWYYGLDGREGAGVDFVAVVQHELAHGLGFYTGTKGFNGEFLFGRPTVMDHFLLDAVHDVTWAAATKDQRVQSAVSVDKLVWIGSRLTAAAPSVLTTGVPGVAISGPAAGPLAGAQLPAGEARFGPPLTVAGVSAQLMPVVSPPTACTALTANDARAVQGRIALIDRGTCEFTVKVKNAQNAGAIGVLIADHEATSPPGDMAGTDPTITIPSVRITLADGNALKAQLATRSRTSSGVVARIGRLGTRMAGADAMGRVLMYAPASYDYASSVTHYDLGATPNQLMEPSIGADVTHQVAPPADLSLPLLQDLGW